MKTTIESTNTTLDTFIQNMNTVIQNADKFTEAYDAFLMLMSGEGSESDIEAAKDMVAQYFGVDEAVLETEAGMELVKQMMNQKFAEALEGNQLLWEEFNEWLATYNEEHEGEE